MSKVKLTALEDYMGSYGNAVFDVKAGENHLYEPSVAEIALATGNFEIYKPPAEKAKTDKPVKPKEAKTEPVKNEPAGTGKAANAEAGEETKGRELPESRRKIMGVPINPTSALLAASLPQSDFNTTLAPATSPKNFRQIVIDGYGVIPDYESPNVGNDNEATGSAYSTKNNKGRADAKSSFNLRLSYDGLGFWAYRSFGVYSVVLVATGVYRHTFKLLNPQVFAGFTGVCLGGQNQRSCTGVKRRLRL